MFATNLTTAEKRILIASLQEYVHGIAGNPSSAIFEAEILWLSDKEAEAEAVLRKVAAGGEPSAAALANFCLAGILAERDASSEALGALGAAARERSTAFMAHWKAAQLQKELGDPRAALQSYRSAAAADAVAELVAPFASEYLEILATVEGGQAAAAELAALRQRHPSDPGLEALARDYES